VITGGERESTARYFKLGDRRFSGVEERKGDLEFASRVTRKRQKKKSRRCGVEEGRRRSS